MPELLSLPDGKPVAGGDKVMIVRGDDTFAITFADLVASLQSALLVPAGALVGRSTAGTGSPGTVPLGQGVAMAGGALIANAADHVALPTLPAVDINANIVVNAAGQPRQLPMTLLKQALASDAIANTTVMWLSGSGAPDPSLGDDFNYYWNDANGDVYHKSAGVWTLVGNVQGPPGAPGDPGQGFEVGPTNAPYDVVFYGANGGVWLGHDFGTNTTHLRNLNLLGNLQFNGVPWTGGGGGGGPTVQANALLGNAPSDPAGPGFSIALSGDLAIGAGRTLAAAPQLLRSLAVWPSLENPARDYGGIGNGVADDSAPVNAAVAAAIAAGTRYVQVDRTFNVPSLDVDCGDVTFVGRGELIGHPLIMKKVIPPFAPPPPLARRTVIAREQMPVFTSAIRTTNSATGVIFSDSVGTPLNGAVSAFAALPQRLLAKIRSDNPGAAITLYNRGIGGQRLTNLDGLPTSFPGWYDDTNRDWLLYGRDLAPDFVVIQFSRNDGLAFSFRALRSILAKLAAWPKPPDVILVNGIGDVITTAASAAAAATADNQFNYASWGMRSAAHALGLPLIDMARAWHLLRGGYDVDNLPLLRDNALTGGSATAFKYNLALPLTWPTACYGYGGIFYIGAGGWATLGNELIFETGSKAALANRGNRFRIRRDSGTGQIQYRIEGTLTSLGAEEDWVFKDWTSVTDWIVGAGDETGFVFQVNGTQVYFEPSSNGFTGTITVDRYTPGFYGHIPRVVDQHQPVVSCAAGSVANVLKLTNGTTDGLAAGLTANPARPNLYMPPLVDSETGAPHPGTIMWELLQPMIDALDFNAAA